MLIPLSIQHMFAMFGASVLVPFLFGISPAIVLLMNGVGTLLFIFITKGKAIDIRWEKDSPWGITHYYDKNEQEIRLNQGTTWVEIVQNDRIDSITYQ